MDLVAEVCAEIKRRQGDVVDADMRAQVALILSERGSIAASKETVQEIATSVLQYWAYCQTPYD